MIDGSFFAFIAVLVSGFYYQDELEIFWVGIDQKLEEFSVEPVSFIHFQYD